MTNPQTAIDNNINLTYLDYKFTDQYKKTYKERVDLCVFNVVRKTTKMQNFRLERPPFYEWDWKKKHLFLYLELAQELILYVLRIAFAICGFFYSHLVLVKLKPLLMLMLVYPIG